MPTQPDGKSICSLSRGYRSTGIATINCSHHASRPCGFDEALFMSIQKGSSGIDQMAAEINHDNKLDTPSIYL